MTAIGSLFSLGFLCVPRDGAVRWRRDPVVVVIPSRRRTTFLAMSSDAGVLAEDEVGVGGEDDAVELERECVGVLVGGEFVLFECSDDELVDQRRESALKRGELFLDRSGAGTHF